MKDRSDDPSHHERTILPRSYISLFSDESRFCISTVNGIVQVRRKRGEHYADACVMETHGMSKASLFGEPLGSIIKLDLLSFRTLAQVEVMASRLCCISIIVPYFGRHQHHMFQQDNTRAHTARATTEFLQQHNIRIIACP